MHNRCLSLSVKFPRCNAAAQSGFTLAELAIVVIVVLLLLGGLLVPLGAQIEMRNVASTQRTLSDIRDALLGYAAANGRLPCPASEASNGIADCTGASDPYFGLVPAATLGIQPTDNQGYAIDAWNNRIRYSVTRANNSAFINQMAPTIQSLGIASLSPDLKVCSAVNSTDCASGAMLASNAVAVVFSLGPNGAYPAQWGSDENNNVNGDKVFVSHEQTASAAFDDIVTWISPNVLYNRMIAAGRLP